MLREMHGNAVMLPHKHLLSTANTARRSSDNCHNIDMRELLPLRRHLLLLVLLLLLNVSGKLSSAAHQHYHRAHSPEYEHGYEFSHAQSPNMQVVKQWKAFTYKFLPHAPVHDTNFYNPANILATGLVMTHDRIFLATPKLFAGVPSTVNWISQSDLEESPVLQPYPDWSFATTGRTDFNCSDFVLVSVYRLRVDSCNRLWLLDAGVSRSLEDYEKTCPPKILVIDLNTDKVVRRIDFPSGVLRGESLFTNMIIDETTAKSGTCDDIYIYISDTVEPSIVVYDSEQDTTWRLSHPAMYADPDFSQATILSDRFVLMDGIVGMAFDDKAGVVYFQPFASDRIFSVTRDVLRAGPISINKVLNVKLVGKKSSQGIPLAISPLDRSLIFSPVTETAVVSWNPITNQQHILAQNQIALQFVSDINFLSTDPGYVYVLSSKFHRFFLKNLNIEEANNRIIKISLPSALHHPDSNKLNSLLSLKSYDSRNTNLYYQFANKFPAKAATSTTSPIHSYFSRPTPIQNKYPIRFDSLNVVSYRNPFNLINQPELYSLSREHQRDRNSYSWLDGLRGEDSTHTTLPSSVIKTDYFYSKTFKI